MSDAPSTPVTSLSPELRAYLEETRADIREVEAKVARYSDIAKDAAWRTFWIAIATVAVSLLAQFLMMGHQRKLSEQEAREKVANSYAEWQLKQLSEFYGPMRALLGQSNSMYRQMNRMLVRADQTRFRLVPGDDFDRQVFEIQVDSTWLRFRTVRHLPDVYGKDFNVEPYFDDVVAVGSDIAKLIREKAGYVRAEDQELIKVLGDYLAHYMVLNRFHSKAKSREELDARIRSEEAVFPTAMQDLVNKGYRAINEEVMHWCGGKH